MKKIIITGITLVCVQVFILGQSHVDALKFSQTFPDGTARYISMGGAFGSLGGDFSSLSNNPAGVGVYRSSEFVFSGGYNNAVSESDYLKNKVKKPDDIYTLNNIGFVGVFKSGSEEGWVSTNLGIGYNRQNNFFYSADIEGTDTTSMVDYFLFNSYGINPDDLHPYYERLAFDAFVIHTLNGNYYTEVPLEGIYKRNTNNAKGRAGEFIINFGANYNNRVYVGAALTINSINYNNKSKHFEENTRNTIIDDNNDGNYFNFYNYYFENSTIGRGISFKLGTIIKPVEALRIGLAIHLPTYYSLTDEFDSYMESNYINGKVYPMDIYGNDLGKRTYEYKLTTPSKLIFSLGYQVQKIGLISLDVERVNYDNMRFKEGGDGYDFYDENKNITNIYRPVFNIRTGGEVKFGPLTIRGGFNYYQSPFESGELNENANYIAVTGGIGYRYENFFIDFGMSRLIHQETRLMYDQYYENYKYPKVNTVNTQFTSTIGFRFN